MKKYMTYGGRSFAAGGAMPMEQLTEFNEGGRHEENSLGGIPQGMNPEGQMNLVEEGETKFDAENYIYSDTLKVDKELAEAFNLSPKMVGKTFADASKMAGRKKSKREGDAIEEAANTLDLENLMDAQEAFKQARIEEKLQEIAELDPNALPALMGQGQPQEGAPQGDPAMGGEMQEAPMDEQAMMEQQMMAQQGGGGQPSPEEMAMMEQQQNMAMGQQEGMMRNGGYATRSYAPGGFMGMNMANAGMMNTGAMGMADPCPCGTPGCLPCDSAPTPTGITTENVPRPQAKGLDTNSTIGGLQFSPNLSFTEEAGFADDRVMQELRQHMLSNYGATSTSEDPAYGTGVSGREDGIPEEKIPEELNNPNISEKTSNSTLNPPRRGIFRPINQANKHNWWSKNIGQHFKAQTEKQRVKTPGIFHNRKRKGLEFGGNLMQPMNQMGSGGKMCYGCGGAMHNYGGYMNNMPGKKFEFGAGLEVASNVLDKASTFMPPLLKEAVKISSTVAGNKAKDKQGVPVTKGDYIGNVIGDLTSSIPGAEKFVDTITDVATSKNKARQEEILDDARNNPNDPRHKQVVDQDVAMANSKQLQNAKKFNNVLDSTLGVATQFINPGEEGLEGASDVADFAPDGVTENVTNTVGQLGDSIPIGNWADIDTENMPEMPENMATGGRMYAGGGYMGPRSYGKGGGLWANIHAKRARGEAPNKPGEEGYPTSKAIKASQNAMGGRMHSSGGYMSPMFAGPELNDEEVAGIINQTTNDDGTYGGDMNSAFIDMSMNANPTDLKIYL
jgi:hypothetical protein